MSPRKLTQKNTCKPETGSTATVTSDYVYDTSDTSDTSDNNDYRNSFAAPIIPSISSFPSALCIPIPVNNDVVTWTDHRSDGDSKQDGDYILQPSDKDTGSGGTSKDHDSNIGATQ